MGLSLSQHGQEAQRIERLRMFSPEQLTTGLIWLSGYDPLTFDAVLDAAESCLGDEDPHSEPEPVCGLCGSAIGIFLRLGLQWRHYRETQDATREDEPATGAGFGHIELFDPGHAALVAWRSPNDL